jgi:hypothetical protein
MVLYEYYSFRPNPLRNMAANGVAKRFQRRRFLEIEQSEARIACDGHVC